MNIKKIGLITTLVLIVVVALIATRDLRPTPQRYRLNVSSPVPKAVPAKTVPEKAAKQIPKPGLAKSPQPCSVPRKTPTLTKEAWKLMDDLQAPCAGG